MDDDKLKKILHDMDIPEPDDNARKRAVNLAMAEFSAHQNEKSQKKSTFFQGIPFLSRLMGTTTQQTRSNTMESKTRKRLMQGGAMLALSLCLLASPVIYQEMQETIYEGAGANAISVDAVDSSFKLDQESDFSTISGNIVSASPKKERANTSDAYISALEEQNVSNTEMAVRSSNSFVPAPTAQGQSVQLVKRMMAPAPYPGAPVDVMPHQYQDAGQDDFENFEVNAIKSVKAEPVSTFSTDVDTASYSFIRRQLNHGQLPAKDAVRVEEMINYFDYNYPLPATKDTPFKPTVAITDSPWAEGKKLMHIGIKGFNLINEKPKSNLVFLLDVSGSMNNQDKLPLLISSTKMMIENMDEDDTISIVTYAGHTGVALEPTSAKDKSKIFAALDNLRAGGGTAGAAGINLAYQLAEENFDSEAVNRVILATDGDFNVGISNRDDLKDLVESKRKSGIFLSVLGFGQGNYKDTTMQTLAQNGNGTAAYIDNLNEARKVLVEEASSTLFPIAKDVKIQVEFNPNAVAEYRLIGYETRALKREDFNNDKVDAGDIGAGHTVTAIYEITPVGSENLSVDPLRYGDKETTPVAEEKSDFDGEYAFLKIRYKKPDEDKSHLMTTLITSKDYIGDIETALKADDKPNLPVDDIAFATSVAGFGQLLKGGTYLTDFTYDDVIKLAQDSKGVDEFGYRAEFIQMVRLAKSAPNAN